MEHVKLQINSSEALERLLGTDPDLPVTLKDRVVERLVNDHLRPLLTDEWHNKVIQEIKATTDRIKSEYVAKVLFDVNWGASFVLSDKIKKQIDEYIATSLNEMLAHKIAAERKEIEARLDKLLKKNKSNIENYIQATLNDSMSNVMNQQLTEVTKHMTELSKYYASEKAALDAGEKPRKITLEL